MKGGQFKEYDSKKISNWGRNKSKSKSKEDHEIYKRKSCRDQNEKNKCKSHHSKYYYKYKYKYKYDDSDSTYSSVIEHLASQSHLKGMDILEASTDLWIEHSKSNILVFQMTPYEYNIFDNVRGRILFVRPTIRSTVILKGTERPSSYTVHSFMGHEICNVKYDFGGCCSKIMKVVVQVADEFYGLVQQIKDDLIVTDALTNKILRVRRINIKNRVGFHVNCEIFYPNKLDSAVGVIGRNGKKTENIIIGNEPRGFYFRSSISPNPPLESRHKLFITTILIGLMLTYAAV